MKTLLTILNISFGGLTMFKLPDYYMTPEEFASVILDSLEESNYFKRNEKAHPEDICISFVTQAEAVAKGAGFVIKKVAQTRNG